jgi:hypothetical protein
MFTVVTGTPTITITAPNTAVNWGIGTTQTIKWKHTLGLNSYVDIFLSTTGCGGPWTPIGVHVANKATAGAWNWTVTNTPTAQACIGIGVNPPLPGIGDTSNKVFTIAPPFITLTTLTASSNWGYGTLQRPAWKSNLGTEKVTVQWSTDGGAHYTTLVPSLMASKGKTTLTVPTLASPTTQARLRVQWIGNPAVSATSPNYRTEPVFVLVLTPNGGDVWTSGASSKVTWSSNLGKYESVSIQLSKDGGATYPTTLLGSTPSDGTQAVTAAGATTQARIRIAWVKDASKADASNANFTIK